MIHKPTYRVISILQTISNNEGEFILSEIAKKTNIPLSTISPILKTLLRYKLIDIDSSTNKYSMGIESYYIGSAFTSKNSTLDLIRAEMDSLSNECNETSQLGILREGQVFYLLKIEGQEHIRIVSEVGGSLPAYSTALGKAILSRYSEEEIDQMYAGALTQLTSKTITDINILKLQLSDVKKNGFASENSESSEYTSCIAVPILQNNEIIASLSIVIPSFRETKEKNDTNKMLLFKYKSRIEKILINNKLI